MNKWARSSAR